jgi:hypothetical protein
MSEGLYLFIGCDWVSKSIKLQQIKEQSFSRQSEQFNFDLFYGPELKLRDLQEALLRLPLSAPIRDSLPDLKAKRRIIYIKEARRLNVSIKRYLTEYVRNPLQSVLLILDIEKARPQDVFLRSIFAKARIYHFRSREDTDTFRLCRQIAAKRINAGLRILHRLLEKGEHAERILGGLHFDWVNRYMGTGEKRRGLQLLLECDIDIKKGRIRPAVALERLLIQLCADKPST